MIKFCKDCRHCVIAMPQEYQCHRSVYTKIDLIKGTEVLKGIRDCREERYPLEIEEISHRYCGKEAKFFEPKETNGN